MLITQRSRVQVPARPFLIFFVENHQLTFEYILHKIYYLNLIKFLRSINKINENINILFEYKRLYSINFFYIVCKDYLSVIQIMNESPEPLEHKK